jgi:hypothetical protein
MGSRARAVVRAGLQTVIDFGLDFYRLHPFGAKRLASTVSLETASVSSEFAMDIGPNYPM